MTTCKFKLSKTSILAYTRLQVIEMSHRWFNYVIICLAKILVKVILSWHVRVYDFVAHKAYSSPAYVTYISTPDITVDTPTHMDYGQKSGLNFSRFPTTGTESTVLLFFFGSLRTTINKKLVTYSLYHQGENLSVPTFDIFVINCWHSVYVSTVHKYYRR